MKKVKVQGEVEFKNIKPTKKVENFISVSIQKWVNQNLLNITSPYLYKASLSREPGSNLVLCDLSIFNNYGDKWEEFAEASNVKKSLIACMRNLDTHINYSHSQATKNNQDYYQWTDYSKSLTDRGQNDYYGPK